jgi:hypothetical protein
VLTDTARSALRASSPTFVFTIGTSVSGGTNIPINIPYDAFDLQAGYPIFGTSTDYFPLRRAANESQYTLGREFLQEVYVSVDWERDVFNISQAVFSSLPLAKDIVTIEPKNQTTALVPKLGPRKLPLSTGDMVGIGIGVVLLLFVLGLVWWFYRRRQKANDSGVSPALPTSDEKNGPNELTSDNVGKSQTTPITDLELEGRMVEEMYAPHGSHEMRGSHQQPGRFTEVFEADSRSPVYELPSSDARRDE